MVSHSTCTESFYKESILNELQGQKVPDEQRRRMLQLLNKFESENDEGLDSDDELPDITERLAGLDLEHATTDEILQMLTPAERLQFESSVREGAAAIRTYVQIWEPWWTQPMRLVHDTSSLDAIPTESQIPPILPDIKDVTALTRTQPNEDVLFNLIDIIASYVFIARFLNGEVMEDSIESASLIWNVSRVLSSNKPFAFSSVGEAGSSVKMNILQNHTYSATLHSFLLVLRDIRCLLSHHHFILSALSHMHQIFATAHTTAKGKHINEPLLPRPTRQRLLASQRKVYFYLCLVKNHPRVADILSLLQTSVDVEIQATQKDVESVAKDRTVVERYRSSVPKGKLVEEL
ncbi:hypothetical protein HDU85_001050 [Gaertneriomyces sp. JEL0708]|nr:hypothetical protein HDU85_001050 [Gaertneriomyces sp. JEL0708]